MVASEWYFLWVTLWDAIPTLHKYNLGIPINCAIICYNDLHVECTCDLYFYTEFKVVEDPQEFVGDIYKVFDYVGWL